LKVNAETFKAEKTTAFTKGKQRDKPKEVALKDFCTEWLKDRQPDFKPETVMLYQNTIRRLLGYFGPTKRLRDITAREASGFFAQLKPLPNEYGNGKKAKLSNWSRHRTLRNCRTMFHKAIEWHIIAENPFGNIERPDLPKPEWHYIEPGEYKRLLNAALSLRWKAFLALGYTAGLRKGELVSLTWDDIDIEAARLKVRNKRETPSLPPFEVKANASRRSIPIPQHTVDILTDLKAYNEMTDNSPYVVLDNGQCQTLRVKWARYQQQRRPWRNRDWQNNTLKNFKALVKRAGVEAKDGRLAIHELRKSCIQNWANEINNPEVVRKWAGHADLKTTMQYYCKVTKDQEAKGAKAIDDLLSDVRMTCKDNQR
jgi:integrase